MVSDGGPAGEKLRRGREIDQGKNRGEKGVSPRVFFFFALAAYHLTCFQLSKRPLSKPHFAEINRK